MMIFFPEMPGSVVHDHAGHRRKAVRADPGWQVLRVALPALLMLLAFASACTVAANAQAAATSLADEPLATADSQVKPNIAMIVDDSGSMIYSYVPDSHAPVASPAGLGRRCDGWSQYNPLYYNPAAQYTPPYLVGGAPYYADGVTRAPDALFGQALVDGYFPAGSVTFGLREPNTVQDLSNPAMLPLLPVCPGGATQACNSASAVRYYFSRHKTNPASTTCEADANYELIVDANRLGRPDASGNFSDAAIARGKTNYANWYSYYRIRGSVMKAAAAEAFMDIDPDQFRAGLFFINSKTAGVQGYANTDLPVADFTGGHRASWFAKLYGSRQAGWTPLRGALARAGRMFAGEISDAPESGIFSTPAGTQAGTTLGNMGTSGLLHWDPVQYSCQKNQVILATDGDWNAFAETREAQYGPYGIDGLPVGDRDGLEGVPPPFRDNNHDANTLADVAYYYYTTDLRQDRCSNSVDGVLFRNLCDRNAGPMKNMGVHMTTSTIGFGVNGSIPYDAGYAGKPDFFVGKSWPPVVDDLVDPAHSVGKIDDLWHAAVNGRGTFFNASNSQELKAGIQGALNKFEAAAGAGAGIAVSSDLPGGNDNFAYGVSYRNGEWTGDLSGYKLDALTRSVASEKTWSAQQQLDARRAADPQWATHRRILYFDRTASTRLRDFSAENLGSAAKTANFSNFCARLPAPGQCGLSGDKLDAAQTLLANDSANLIAWLRGDASNEILPRADKNFVGRPTGLYRRRSHVLGDIAGAAPVYAKGPPFDYSYDPTYGEFKQHNAERAAMLYAGANDGMLHAITATSGEETWAFVPRAVMGNLWHLADDNYARKHWYYVDGKPVLGDVCSKTGADARLCDNAADWHSILVAGLNKGGCGYYALDVTMPGEPKGLWEFTNDNMGYTYGEPIIAKLASGKWVVIVASGYNNMPGHCSGNGDGQGHVFILDAMTGDLLQDMVARPAAGSSSTGAGLTPAAPAPGTGTGTGTVENVPDQGSGRLAAPVTSASGLARLNVWVDNPSVPVVSRIFGGDLNGNLWRFEPGTGSGTGSVGLVASFKDDAGTMQPITTTPQPVLVRAGTQDIPVIMVGTGKYLAVGDAADQGVQSVYAVHDRPGSAGLANARGGSMLPRVIQDAIGVEGDPAALIGKQVLKITGEQIDWEMKEGWYLDLKVGRSSSGERINVDMVVEENALLFVANAPAANICDVGMGKASLYYVDINSGLPLGSEAAAPGNTVSSGGRPRNSVGGIMLSTHSVAVGLEAGKDSTGNISAIITHGTGVFDTEAVPGVAPGSGTGVQRTSWRELVD